MNEREQVERRQKDRRYGDRRQKPDFICDKCAGKLIYFIPAKIDGREYLWCDACRQKYLVMRYPDRRAQIARVNNA